MPKFNFADLEKDKKSVDIKPKAKNPKKSKKIALTDRNMTKEELINEIYSLGKKSLVNITSSKLRATLEDFKLYSKRK